jgi:hypothetical protein
VHQTKRANGREAFLRAGVADWTEAANRHPAWEETMLHRTARKVLGATSFALLVAAAVASSSWAQQPPVRVRGEIVKVDGNTLLVKGRDGANVTVKLSDSARVSGVIKAELSDIKTGSYIGVSAMPQPDGSQRALHVHIFPEALRGLAEGHTPWDVQPGSTMTNATVAEVTGATDAQTFLVKYKNGEKKIIVPSGTPIVTYAPGKMDELKPGAKIMIFAAQKQPDDTLTAGAINVGREGMTPPM